MPSSSADSTVVFQGLTNTGLFSAHSAMAPFGYGHFLMQNFSGTGDELNNGSSSANLSAAQPADLFYFIFSFIFILDFMMASSYSLVVNCC